MPKKGQAQSAEAKAKIRAAAKAQWARDGEQLREIARDPYRRAKISQALAGRVFSPETRKKMSEGQRRRAGRDVNSEAELERRLKISASSLGKKHPPGCRHCMAARAYKHTEEARIKLSNNMARRLSEGQLPTYGTRPELQMAAILEEFRVEYEWQHRIGRCVVDFWLPRTNEVVEVDGVYWHPDGPDRERDQYLKDTGISAVHHVTDLELEELIA